jgi:predicted PurR-regulated permease PerM
MTHRRLYNTLLGLLTVIAAIYLLRLLWAIASPFTDLLLVLALAWLITFILRPAVVWLAEGPPAQWVVKQVWKRWGERRAVALGHALVPVAITLVYLALLGTLIVTLVAFVPLIVSQARQLGMNLGDYLGHATEFVTTFETDIARRFNVPPELVNQFYKPEEVSKQLTNAAQAAPRVVAYAIRTLASGLGEALLVLALSFYLMLDSARLKQRVYDLIPNRFHDEYDLTVATVSRSFGGFLRGQVVMAGLSGVVTAIAAGFAGVRYGAIIGAIVGLIVIIPLIGAPVAMFLPSIIALVQGIPLLTALLLLAFLTVFQQILLHLIVPRIMSESVGMPPALTLVSVLIGTKLWGVWGFIFGIPVAGAIYAVSLAMLGRFKREQDRLDIERDRDEL